MCVLYAAASEIAAEEAVAAYTSCRATISFHILLAIFSGRLRTHIDARYVPRIQQIHTLPTRLTLRRDV